MSAPLVLWPGSGAVAPKPGPVPRLRLRLGPKARPELALVGEGIAGAERVRRYRRAFVDLAAACDLVARPFFPLVGQVLSPTVAHALVCSNGASLVPVVRPVLPLPSGPLPLVRPELRRFLLPFSLPHRLPWRSRRRCRPEAEARPRREGTAAKRAGSQRSGWPRRPTPGHRPQEWLPPVSPRRASHQIGSTARPWPATRAEALCSAHRRAGCHPARPHARYPARPSPGG